MGGDEDHVRREAAAVARKGSRDDGRRLNRPSRAQKTPKTPCCISFSGQGTMVEATATEGGSSPAIDPGASLFDGYVCYEVLNNIVPNYILLVKDYQNFIFCGDLQKLQLFSGILQPFGAAVKILCFHPLDAAKGATIDEPKR
ncbi:hypothetical protein MRB53_001501 [Persea americana]|uniref:Uncharacterized protein n=1 Tax=Persea americana TaxID=3435 RepID=A0ACC2MSV7_PERAE|nr:hypothetical protein MRB53_001501 [Persea americana]